MLIIKHSVETTASPAQIWQVLQDVESWNSWDHGIEFSQLDGPFETGTTGSFQPKGGPVIKTLLTHVQPFRMFVQEAYLFLSTVVMSHYITQDTGKTQVTFQTDIRGPLAFFFAYLIGCSIKMKVPVEMEQMIKKAKTIE